jgi:hypothetical protein
MFFSLLNFGTNDASTPEISISKAMLVGIASLVSLLMGQVVYLLYLHPLAKFPGPALAAISRLWLYRVTSRGDPEVEFERLHKLYGR